MTAFYKGKVTVEMTEAEGVELYSVHVAFRKEEPVIIRTVGTVEVEKAQVEADVRKETARLAAETEKARLVAETEKARLAAETARLQAESATVQSTNLMFSKALESNLDNATLLELLRSCYGHNSRRKPATVKCNSTDAHPVVTNVSVADQATGLDTPIIASTDEHVDNDGLQSYNSVRSGTHVTQVNPVTNEVIAVHRSIAEVKKSIDYRGRNDGVRNAIINKTVLQGFLFRLATDEEKSSLEKVPHVNSKAIEQLDSSGQVTREYVSIMEASRTVLRSQATLNGALNDPRKTCAGFFWRYKNAEDATTKTPHRPS